MDYRGSHDRSESMGKSQIVDVSSKVMLASIIILFLIIVLVIVLHFYSKWYWRRRFGNQSTVPRRFVFTPSRDQNVSIRQGLAASVIKSLPIVTFSSNEFKDGIECSVCLSEVEEGEKARVLPKCNHGFHVDCIDMWFQSHSTCPLCRNPVSILPDSSDREAQSSPVVTAENNSNNNGLLSIEAAAPSYPTNVMFWGNQTRVSTRDSSEEETWSSSSPPSSSVSSSPSLRPDRPLVIDIPDRLSHGFSFSSPPSTTPSSGRRVSEDDLKSPVSTRFKSLRKLLSREKRVVPSSPSTVVVDIEQGEVVAGSSKMSPAGYAIGTSTTGEERSPSSAEEMNV